MKKTKWFPGNQKPELPGVYERGCAPPWSWRGQVVYSYWNGKFWGGWSYTKAGAVRDKDYESEFQASKWRGLAEKP